MTEVTFSHLDKTEGQRQIKNSAKGQIPKPKPNIEIFLNCYPSVIFAVSI